MRNKITLYIEGLQADLDEGSFLLLNYTREDLSNPTIVKNSFSRQITLKGTARNDAIFGHMYRNDRNTVYGSPYTGPNFDPTRKTSFAIYNDAQEILESGYLKLDEVVTTRKRHDYKVTLYGGLGSFLYGLSYKANGDKMSLADLDFGETLDFVINRATVAAAWQSLSDGDLSGKWTIINFMPSYAGLPPSPFDANKCLVHARTVGLQDRAGDYGMYTTGPDDFVLATLNEKVTGNDAKDYRSYLQKPVIRLKSVIDAICDPSNNGGWTVQLDPDFNDPNGPYIDYWEKPWITLPMLNDLNINETSVTSQQTMAALNNTYGIVGGGSGNVGITVQAQPVVDLMGLPNYNYKLWCKTSQGNVLNYLVFVLHLYDSSNNEIATARYRITSSGLPVSSRFPQPDFTFDHIENGYFVDSDGNRVTFPLYIRAENATSFMVEIEGENYYWGSASFNPGDHSWEMWQVGDNTLANNFGFSPNLINADVDVEIESSSTIRTGATITKAMLLSGSQTPADYLLSFCKMFGLQMFTDKTSKTIEIWMRQNSYDGNTVRIDGRIDRGREIVKKPFSFNAKWYLFGNEVKGEYAGIYKNNYNRPYGQYRVNTGYDFDSEQKSMTEDIVFNNAVTVMETSKFFCDLVQGGKRVPSVLLSGGKYSLYNGSDTMSIELPNLFGASKTWINSSYPMHDNLAKMQFHGPQNAHIDERDTLVFFDGMHDASGERLSLTDDTGPMLALNGNVPCWLPQLCDYDADVHLDELPVFSRYIWSSGDIVLQLDWGDPQELLIPGATIAADSNIFDQFWSNYIADRYDDDSAVVTCYVDLRGMRVNESLLRKFYWFDGALWVLNRIIDYSLTTYGPTKCEFVKVQDKTNYTSL